MRLVSGVPAGLAALALLTLSAPGCGENPTASLAAQGADLTTGFQQASWGSNVTVTYTNGQLRYVSNGIPNHARDAQYAVPTNLGQLPSASNATAMADPTRAQNYDYSIPLTPTKAATPTATNLGVIGVMISGASLFNPYEGDGRTVATQSNFSVSGTGGSTVWFLDSCSGHPTPMMGTYHYHALPKCITSVVDGTSGPSHIIGVAFDGYPIYGDRDINGATVAASALDACNGITSPTPEFPNGVYHYVLLDVAGANSSIRCFSGVVNSSLMQQGMPGMGPMPPMPPAAP